MSKLIVLLVTIFMLSCSSLQTSSTLVLDYEDFGPPVVAHEVIGMDWWQWLSHGESRPKDYPIKVVIFRDISLQDVKSRFPVEPELEQDYRYLEYSDAMLYLDRLIEENVIESLTGQLIDTRNKIESNFSSGEAVQVY